MTCSVALCSNRTAMQFDEVFDQCQTQTEAAVSVAARAIGLQKPIEHIRRDLLTDSGSRIDDSDLHA